MLAEPSTSIGHTLDILAYNIEPPPAVGEWLKTQQVDRQSLQERDRARKRLIHKKPTRTKTNGQTGKRLSARKKRAHEVINSGGTHRRKNNQRIASS